MAVLRINFFDKNLQNVFRRWLYIYKLGKMSPARGEWPLLRTTSVYSKKYFRLNETFKTRSTVLLVEVL